MVQFRFWAGHFRTTEWWSVDGGFSRIILPWACLLGTVQLAESVLYNPLLGVKGTERYWNTEDLKGNPTEYTHHTIRKLANCAAFKLCSIQESGKRAQSANPRLSHIINYLF
jgi:hypothetical protein